MPQRPEEVRKTTKTGWKKKMLKRGATEDKTLKAGGTLQMED